MDIEKAVTRTNCKTMTIEQLEDFRDEMIQIMKEHGDNSQVWKAWDDADREIKARKHCAVRMSKKDFIRHLLRKYDADGTASIHSVIHDEQCWDDYGNESVNRLTLFYKDSRHIGTWMSGEGWEFKHYDAEGIRLTDCCACYSTYHDDSLICRACYEYVTVGEGDGAENRKVI